MNVVDGIITSLKREREPDRVYSFVQGIMELFARNFDEKFGDSLREDDIVILPNKDITIHKVLGFDSSWCGSASPSIVYGDQHPALLKELNERYQKINPDYKVTASGSLVKIHAYGRDLIHNYQVDGLLKTREIWEKWHEGLVVGDIADYHVDELDEAIHQGIEHDFLEIPSVGLLMEPLIATIGIDSIGRFARKDPAFLHEICASIMVPQYKKMDFLCKSEAPVIIIPDDCAYKGRPILSPSMYKEFIIPHLSKMIEKAHKKGKLVMMHSDGFIEPYYPLFIEIGLDAHESLEPVAGMDLKHCKEQYGDKLSLVGNIDSSRLLPYGTPEEVAAEVKKCLRDGAPGGGYMFSPCTDLTDSCKVENAVIMMETYRKYRSYPINIP
ncbi:MAG: uroporphyrinogen decarboxylase family protein [Candidatus Sigynarchaeota archaeon]